jgi:soluble lytic murein transglycosylase-like protein
MAMRTLLIPWIAICIGAAHAECYQTAARQHGIDPLLLEAICTHESDNNPFAVGRNSSSIDVGLCQINSQHFKRISSEGTDPNFLWDSCYNIKFGARILADCQRQLGNTWLAVSCYNAGRPKLGQSDFSLRQKYVSHIQKRYYQLRAQRGIQ